MNSSQSLQDDRVFHSGCITFSSNYRTPYGHDPSLGAAIPFLVLFVISLAIHTYQTFKHQRITSSIFAAAAFLECFGWSGRIWSSQCPYNRYPYIMQLITFTFGPAFISLSGLLILRLFMLQSTKQSTHLSANVCCALLSTLTILSTTLQLIGSAITIGDLPHPGMGTTFSIAGHALQIYTILIILLFLLLHNLQPQNPFLSRTEWLVQLATSVSFVALLIRNIYHMIADIQGQSSPLYAVEGYFLGLEAAMVLLALGVYNIFDPVVLLGSRFWNHMAISRGRSLTGGAAFTYYRGAKFEFLTPQTSRQV